MEENPLIPMKKPCTILRKSIYTFLQNYQYFTVIAAIVALPYASSVLLSHAFVLSSPFFIMVHSRLIMLFNAAGFPPSAQIFSLLNLKLAQTISSSIFSLPFTVSSLLFAKSCVIQSLNREKPTFQPSFSSVISLYSPILVTYIYNSFVILSIHTTFFSLLIMGYNCVKQLGLTSPNWLIFFSIFFATIYSIFLANALMICNLALVSSGMDKSCEGFVAILKACVMIQGRTSTALSLALPLNLVLAAFEALFQYRVVQIYYFSEKITSFMVLEGFLIAYLYAIFIVLDTVVTCVFIKSCKTGRLLDHEGGYYCSVYIEDDRSTGLVKNFKILEVIA